MIRLKPIASRRVIVGYAIWFLGWAAITFLSAFVLSPSERGHGTHTQLGLPPCGSVVLFDRPCLGCGLTTAFTATVQGDLATAWGAHKLGAPLYAVYTISAFVALFAFLRQARVDMSHRAFNYASAAFAAAFVAYGVWRFATVSYDSPAHITFESARSLSE